MKRAGRQKLQEVHPSNVRRVVWEMKTEKPFKVSGKVTIDKCLSCLEKQNEHVMTYALENGGGREKQRKLETSIY